MPRIIDLYWSVKDQFLFDPAKGIKLKNSELPGIKFREQTVVNLRVCEDTNQTPYTRLDASWAFSAAIDNDWDHATDPLIKTLNANINLPGDWQDGATATIEQGELSIRLDANTQEFENAVDAEMSGELRKTALELKAYDGTPSLVWSIFFAFKCYNLLDDDGSSTPATPSNHYTKTETDALVAGVGALVRVADFASLPGSPADLATVYVTSVSDEVQYDAVDGAWYYRGTSVVFDASEES